ncbi:MAG: prenyltransferase/squalene oxidase repeat-containing protein [Thermoguttaceae bacterium]
MAELPPPHSDFDPPPFFSPEENGDERDYVLTREDAAYLDQVAESDPLFSESDPIPLSKKVMSGLVSGVVNITILILLALVFFQGKVKPIKVDAVFSDREGDQLDTETLDEGNLAPNPADDYRLTVPDVGELSDIVAPERLGSDTDHESLWHASEASHTDITSLFDGRTDPGTKNDLLAKYGGNKQTVDAVGRGLLWLKKQQRADGSWSLQQPYRNGAMAENPTAATGLALLAFQGDGNTRYNGEYLHQVRKAWKWLLKQQSADGCFFREGVSTGRFYTQAVCTIAIAELVGMEKRVGKGKDLLDIAQKAVDYLVERQNDRLGGWRYDVEQHETWVMVRQKERKLVVKEMAIESDLSVTGWCLMALISARAAGLYVPDETLEKVSGFLDRVAVEGGSSYFYALNERAQRPSMTATGLLCREYLGWDRSDPLLLKGAATLVRKENLVRYPTVGREEDGSESRQRTNVYGWYSASMMLKHLGANHEYWRAWNKALCREMPAHQEPENSPEAGSWDPTADDYCFGGGRLYVTCLSICCMEVYYRHLALYENR